MNNLPLEYQFFIALAAGVIGITIFLAFPFWYLNILLLLLVSAVLILTRTWQDRGFYLVCSGEPLVIACSIMNIWAGLFTVCMLAGIVCGAFGLLESGEDLKYFALFCGGSFLVALLIQISNHVLLPLLFFGCIIALILFIQSVRTYKFRKQYTGA